MAMTQYLKLAMASERNKIVHQLKVPPNLRAIHPSNLPEHSSSISTQPIISPLSTVTMKPTPRR
eukprot:scaffold15785_cov400-Alexandrium_tamarense.AAC.1